ncbi:MAG TPA: hypothetical protein VME68_19505 [Acidobacteriaceae bacterium]|nr:hypothetical protein [Acidobacteriaceae bacterium]
MIKAALFLGMLVAPAMLAAQTAPTSPIARHYTEGEALHYHMTAANDAWHYTADAAGVVKKAADGSWVEEFRWTAMTSDGQAVVLSPATLDARLAFSLDPSHMPSGPNLAGLDPRFVGPVTDLMTFYVDDWLFQKIPLFHQAGDRFYVPNPNPSSWADGTRVLTGTDAIDFDLHLQSLDAAAHTAVLVVHHVPPAKSPLKFPAAWMESAIADTPNNWMEITKTAEGKYEAGAGKETFDVTITVSTVDGKILSATMNNPVVLSRRICEDAALTQCGAPKAQTIHRHVEIALVP